MPRAFLRSGLTVHYQRVGEGPDLVLIHGLTGNLAVWHLKMVPILRDHFRLLTYDLRGHGYTDMPPSGYTVGDMAEDLRGLLDELDIERPFLVGHSYGADTALNFALRYPQRVQDVVAIEAGLSALIELRREAWEGWDYWVEALGRFGFVVPPDRRTDLDYMIRLSLQVPKLYGPATGRPRKPEPVLNLLNTTTLVKDYEVVGDLTLENIGRIHTPVLLIYGDGSAFLGSFEELRARLPNAREILLPPSGWGHFGPIEQPEIIVQHLLAHLRRAGEPQPIGAAA